MESGRLRFWNLVGGRFGIWDAYAFKCGSLRGWSFESGRVVFLESTKLRFWNLGGSCFWNLGGSRSGIREACILEYGKLKCLN